jgi:hypothetical protein
MEACRAWTTEPSLRTFQVQLVAGTPLRWLQALLNQAWGHGNWWLTLEWHPQKCETSIVDRRLFRGYCAEFAQYLYCRR